MGGYNFSYFAKALIRPQASAAPTPAAAAHRSGLQRSNENNGYTLVAGGFARDADADALQEWLTTTPIKQIPDATDAKPVYKKGSTAHLKFKTKDAVWRFLKSRTEHLGLTGSKLWFSFPRAREERIYGSTLSALKRALTALLPVDTPPWRSAGTRASSRSTTS